jgi:DNA-binding transcriptional LysR family regulator
MPFKRGQLRNFVTVADEGQLTRAARKLHVAQPALSQAISHLESELGIVLLVRHPRGVTLTPAGEVFLAKARVALAAANDAASTARSLARAAEGSIDLGFLGSPPTLHFPQLFASFAATHPDTDVCLRELPFPSGPIGSWLEEVDIALCHPPSIRPGVCVQALRADARVVIVPKTHPLAERTELCVAEVLEETFLGFHPEVDPSWAGFWRLDDHRTEPAPHVTADRTLTPAEMLAIIASGRAIATLPSCHVDTIVRILPDVVAIPLRDARPAMLSLVWRKDNCNRLVEELVAVGRDLADHDAEGLRPAGAGELRPVGAKRAPSELG